ncbi:ribonuclease P [Halosimplex carlsbadense 2-9-1]|uniref:Ribonuclease P protein component 3 n=1 Tax=Halosimplex carlsbadense 2-9-1 TaxID=797114 RepID=M0CP03_9EURY|nr:RNase P subunit p30 family protein [Halosimplex carlsbadense]ELZ24122.1 ribonuclease P [Halosimplex carlsbadense 2-9-1]
MTDTDPDRDRDRDRRFEAVHAHPDGEATVARHASTAAEYGFDGVVVRNHGGAPAEFDTEEIGDRYGIDVVEGVEIRAEDPSRASGFVGNHRRSKTIVAVDGGSAAINRFAVEQPAVDVLAHPMAGDGDVNHVLANAAADNGVRFEFSLGRVLRADGGQRVQAIRGLRKLREIVEACDAPYVVSADPRSHLQLRAPRELVAVGEVLGFDPAQVRSGLAEWGWIVDRNRRLTSDAFVEPGVYRGSVADGHQANDDEAFD